MKKEHDEQLVKSCPNLYRDRYAPMNQTAMCWGFGFGDGWFEIVRELSEKLEAEIMKLPEAEREACRATQVKEKFGGLRFYMTTETERMSELIDEAGEASEKTCEECGAPGKIRDGGWLRALCDGCEEKRQALAAWVDGWAE